MDRIIVQHQFRKAIWTCPKCGQEDIEDRPMQGGASYIHTCSKCSTEFNQSGPNMREYNGSINYSKDEYETIKTEDIETEKTKRCDDWLYEVKHPPAYIEPTVEDYNNMTAEKQKEVDDLKAQRAEAIRKSNQKAFEEGTGYLYDPETGNFMGIVN